MEAPSGSADELAAEACARLRLVEQGVRADASGETVLLELARARAAAQAASERDPRWVALAGGVAALDEAVRADDPGATSVGLRVARAECG